MPSSEPRPPEKGEPAAGPPALTEDAVLIGMRQGTFYWTLANVFSKAVKLAAHVVLAWLLNPADYGLVAMTVAVMMVLQLLSEFGIGVAIIQKSDMTQDYACTAFWLNGGLSAAMAAFACAMAPGLAAFYGDERVTLLIRVSSLGFVIIAMRTIPMALLRKKLEFKPYALLETLWHTSTGLLSIVFALLGARYWSLVVPAMICGLAITPLWFRYAQWRPAALFDRKLAGAVMSFSKNVVLVSLLLILLNNAGFVLAGRLLGTDLAGTYKFAMENGMFVVFNFAWVVGGVSLSGFALLDGDGVKLRGAFRQGFEVLAATTLPVHAVLFALAPLIFDGIFPEKWTSATALFRVLLLYGAVRALMAQVTPFYNAVNRTGINLRYYAVITPIALAAMYWGCREAGLAGLAWTTSITQAAAGIFILYLTPRLFGWARLGYLRLLAPYGGGSAAAGLTAYGGMEALGRIHFPPVLNFMCCAALGSLVYGGFLYLFARERLRWLVSVTMPEHLRQRLAPFLRGLA